MSSTVSQGVTSQQRESFYAAAVAGLRALDARERKPRRFGPDADARWSAFKGSLTDADRIDWLLRDAASWGAAFSPSEAFDLFGLAPDEPFGPDWQPLSAVHARRAFTDAPTSLTPAELGRVLHIQAASISVPTLTASTRLVVAGGAALIAAAQAFTSPTGLSWSDQVLAIATSPAHRQLAALLAIVVGSAARTRLARPAPDLQLTLRAAGFAQVDQALVSPDAEPDCAAFARAAIGTT